MMSDHFATLSRSFTNIVSIPAGPSGQFNAITGILILWAFQIQTTLLRIRRQSAHRSHASSGIQFCSIFLADRQTRLIISYTHFLQLLFRSLRQLPTQNGWKSVYQKSNREASIILQPFSNDVFFIVQRWNRFCYFSCSFPSVADHSSNGKLFPLKHQPS